jgi:hypothetical protein
MSTSLETDEESVTVVTMAPLLLLPHPLRSKQGARTASVMQLEIFHNFISLASPSSRAPRRLRPRRHDFFPHYSNFSAAQRG